MECRQHWLMIMAAGWACAAGLALAQTAPGAESGFSNPLTIIAQSEPVESCADPSVLEEDELEAAWTLYCTTDPLSGDDRGPAGGLTFRLIPMFRSADLVRWSYEGDAFDRDPATEASAPPSWAAPTALLWAPEGDAIEGKYYLFFGVTDVGDDISGEPACARDGAIGYAVAESPLGPWVPADKPLIEPRRSGPGCDFLWTYDPEVITTQTGQRFIYYGSYYGGIEVQELTVAPDGSLRADPATAVAVAISNRYEGAEVVQAEGAYWLFVSASNCCNGPQTGYAVFVGRAESPTGPFLDREGVSFLDTRVGGTPVIMQNGNGWIGPGHNTVLQDRAGEWWTLYHAIDEAEPYFSGEVGFTKRPLLLDRLSWVSGWPVVLGGPSRELRPVPVLAAEHAGLDPTREGDANAQGETATPMPELSDEFDEPQLNDAWTWLREPPSDDIRLDQGVLNVAIRDTDLFEDRDDAPILLREPPAGNYLLETRVAVDLPPEGCCHNFVQAGLVIHLDDDNYVKLVTASIWETRQTEFAREMGPVPEGYPRYGSSVGGPTGEMWSWLRVEVRQRGTGEVYTAHTSPDGQNWVQGATWTHEIGPRGRIGLLAMGGSGDFTARFDYFRVHELAD